MKEKEELIEEKVHEILLDPNDEFKVTNIEAGVEDELRIMLIEFLRRNKDCFAWSHSNIRGIDPKVVTYLLKVDPSF